jgi:hypothetical protein
LAPKEDQKVPPDAQLAGEPTAVADDMDIAAAPTSAGKVVPTLRTQKAKPEKSSTAITADVAVGADADAAAGLDITVPTPSLALADST